MQNSPYSEKIYELIKKEYPLLYDEHNSIIYLDHAGASLYSKSQINGFHQELEQNLLCNPHTNFGKLKALPDINVKIREIRQQILRFFNTTEENHTVIFTSGATQSLKLVAENYTFQEENQIFAYLDECHTSVIGIREILQQPFDVWSEKNVLEKLSENSENGGLFAFPAMSNYSGQKFPMKSWIQKSHEESKFKILLDAASFVSTNPLNLTEIQCDFCCISFYKIFGFPTGIGALIVRNDSLKYLKKRYFGGGTVEMHLIHESKYVQKPLEAQFEDGTTNFQAILALKYGLDLIQTQFKGMKIISQHTFLLAKYLHDELISLKYAENGKNVIQMYSNAGEFQDPNVQGGIINFNILQRNGSVFGFTEFKKIAVLNNLVVRVGCFCNIGSCQKYLGLTDEDIEYQHKSGHVCGDNVDIIDGKPTGSIRISFGHYSTIKDANFVIQLIKDYFRTDAKSCGPNSGLKNTNGKLCGLYLYPIKSCAPLKITEGSWPLSKTSMKYDRQFVIMQGKSTLTQKNEPLLTQIQPKIDLTKKIMTLSATWQSRNCQIFLQNFEKSSKMATNDITNNPEMVTKLCSGKVCGDIIEGYDCGDEVADWLEETIGLTGLRLIKLLDRKSSQKLQSLANEAPFLCLSKTSAKNLHDQIQSTLNPDQNVEWLLEQFRGNLVFEGFQPYSEENWKSIKIGNDVLLQSEGPCTRCNIISINQVNSERVQEPLQYLAKNETRRFKFGLLAGSNISMEGLNLTIGDEISIE